MLGPLGFIKHLPKARSDNHWGREDHCASAQMSPAKHPTPEMLLEPLPSHTICSWHISIILNTLKCIAMDSLFRFYFKIIHLRAVWPDWAILELLGNNYNYYKSSPNVWWLLGQLWKPSLFKSNWWVYFLGNF